MFISSDVLGMILPLLMIHVFFLTNFFFLTECAIYSDVKKNINVNLDYIARFLKIS